MTLHKKCKKVLGTQKKHTVNSRESSYTYISTQINTAHDGSSSGEEPVRIVGRHFSANASLNNSSPLGGNNFACIYLDEQKKCQTDIPDSLKWWASASIIATAGALLTVKHLSDLNRASYMQRTTRKIAVSAHNYTYIGQKQNVETKMTILIETTIPEGTKCANDSMHTC